MKYKNGYALIEVIISLSIIVVLVTGLVAASTSALKASQFAREKSLSVRYAQEAMEVVRNIRDTNPWTIISGYNGTSRMLGSNNLIGASPCTGASAPNLIVSTIYFTRCVTFAWVDLPNNIMGVTATVYWIDGGKQFSSSLTTHFTPWR